MELDDIFSNYMKYKWDKGLNSEHLSPYTHAIWGTLEPFGLEGSPLRLIIDGITSLSGQGVFGDADHSPLKRVGNTFSDIRKTIWSFYSSKSSICQNIRGIYFERASFTRELTYSFPLVWRCLGFSGISNCSVNKKDCIQLFIHSYF